MIGRVLFQSPGLAFVASWKRGTGLWRFRPVPVQHRLPASKCRNRLFPGSLPRVVAAPREAPPSSVTRSRLDRWGRSLVDLVSTLQELVSLKVGFVSLSEALDMTTASGRALAGMLAVFAEFERDILRDRVRAGIAQARKEGKPHGRPQTITKHSQTVRSLFKKGISKREIAKRLNISRTSVRRLLEPIAKTQPSGN